jgi:hypothetical protein
MSTDKKGTHLFHVVQRTDSPFCTAITYSQHVSTWPIGDCYMHGRRNYETQNPKCRLYWCFRLEIQLVTLVFSTPLVNCFPSTFSLTSSSTPPQSNRTVADFIDPGYGDKVNSGTVPARQIPHPPSSHQDMRQSLAPPTCHLSTLSEHYIEGAGSPHHLT